jgi:glycosyltransferase involved in cell wall biosynthesis
VGARELRVVFLGRLVEQKRPANLVREWNKLSMRPSLYPARLDIYGGSNDNQTLNDLRQYVHESGQAGNIGIHGEYDLKDLDRILTTADLLVLPSTWEGLPLVLVEAMQRGIPVVATDAGGTEELGMENPDVVITSCDWSDFEKGLLEMAAKFRADQIDSIRLYKWTEKRYGFERVSRLWYECLTDPARFFMGAKRVNSVATMSPPSI